MSLRKNAVRDVEFREYFNYVGHFWNDIALFIIPDSHVLIEHLRKLGVSIEFIRGTKLHGFNSSVLDSPRAIRPDMGQAGLPLASYSL